VASAGRPKFERSYDLTERVIADDARRAPVPLPAEGQRSLVRSAMKALGVAGVAEVADYFRLPLTPTKARLRELVDAGELEPIRVDGWKSPVFSISGADASPVPGHGLLSPFDSLIWDRARTKRMFGFEHSFEIYVKPERRRYGYYVLPFRLGENLVARVDLKADRGRGTLLVLAAHLEPGYAADDVVGPLADELRLLCEWLELATTEVCDRGSLAPALAAAPV
jgi:uncharacterized protein YcaQ